jgi:ribonucleoside-diphosphate reductase alpha chain
MVTMSDWHPDIVEFIEAKKDKGRLSKFNMSVLCSDAFMEAVEKDKPWQLGYPNYEKYGQLYKKHWDGNLDKWIETVAANWNGEPAVVVYHEFESARELWALIMDNTYNRNEPGVLFVDTINRMNNLFYLEHILSTNPCGEQILPSYGSCLLGSINLTQYIDFEVNDWDYESLATDIPVIVRLMDNVNDITKVPLKGQAVNLANKRRIGLGVMGYGSALMMLKLRYGSKAALTMTEKLMSFIANEAYSASAILAEEKGHFPLYDEQQYLKSEFVKSVLTKKTIGLIKEHGIRNSHLLSIQPTGNTSVVANLVSGGCEPSFAIPGYVRTAIQPVCPEGLHLPKVDWFKRTFNSKSDWQWIKEGDEDLLGIEFEGKTWKFDQTRGLLKEEWIEDYAVSHLKETGQWNERARWACSAMDLTVDDHVKTMQVFARYVDSAISKTINLPNNYEYDDFKQVYMKAWKAGVKGFTTYRDGTMTSVLATSSSLDDKSPKKRPRSVDCDVHHITVKGEEYFVLVGLVEGKPYEVFAGKNGFLHKNIKKGKVVRKRKGFYKVEFDNGDELAPITAATNEMEEVICRLTSGLLRSGNDMNMVVEQLEKVGEKQSDIHSFARATSRALKKYIKDGTKTKDQCPECNGPLIRQEGCKACKSCGWSACI